MQEGPVVTPVVVPPVVTSPVETLRGEELIFTLNQMVESINTDISKFFDKGQKVASRRCRKSLSELIRFSKLLRKEISEVKIARYSVK
jgi:hypothetical protein